MEHAEFYFQDSISEAEKSKFGSGLSELPYYIQLMVKFLPLLNNVSTQLLQIVAGSSPQTLETDILGVDDNSTECQLFNTLFKALKEVKRLYGNKALLTVSDIAPGIWFPGSESPSILYGFEQFILTTIRKYNLVVFVLTLLGKFDYGFQFLNDRFIDVFCTSSMNGIFEKEEDLIDGGGYIGSTTSMAGSCLSSALGGKLLKTHTILYLNLKTQAFIAAMSEPDGVFDPHEILDDLFPQDMVGYLQMRSSEQPHEFQLTPSERDFITRCQRRREALESSLTLLETRDIYRWSDFLCEFLSYVSKNLSQLVFGKRIKAAAQPIYFKDSTDLKQHCDLAVSTPNSCDSSHDGSPSVYHDIPAATGSTSSTNHTPVPVPVSTQIPMRKKPRQKRMWVEEEESILISALKIYGPSWSKILELHGAGGSVSETLKNRTQVQLKDKARNWKMYYLKNGLPVPSYLIKVTGNLQREEKFKKRSKAKRDEKRLCAGNSSSNNMA